MSVRGSWLVAVFRCRGGRVARLLFVRGLWGFYGGLSWLVVSVVGCGVGTSADTPQLARGCGRATDSVAVGAVDVSGIPPFDGQS